MVLPIQTKPKSEYVPQTSIFGTAIPMDNQWIWEPLPPSDKEIRATGLTPEEHDALIAEL